MSARGVHSCRAGSVMPYMLAAPAQYGLVRQDDGRWTCPGCGETMPVRCLDCAMLVTWGEPCPGCGLGEDF